MTVDPPIFRATRAKVSRARLHLEELTKLIGDFESGGGGYWKPIDDLPPGATVGFEMGNKPLPEMLSPAVGDVIHNLRAALDLMASELVRMNGRDDGHVHFPIVDDATKLKSRIKSQNFDDAGADTVDLLQKLKPWPGGNDELAELHSLDLMDKHRVLVDPVFSVYGPTIQMWEDDGTHNPRVISDPSEPLKLVFNFPAHSAFAGSELLSTLERIAKMVEHVVESFAVLVASRPV